MLFYYFLPFIVNNHYLLFQVSSGHNSVNVQNRTHVHMNFLLRITHTITSQSTADSSWITLYIIWSSLYIRHVPHFQVNKESRELQIPKFVPSSWEFCSGIVTETDLHRAMELQVCAVYCIETSNVTGCILRAASCSLVWWLAEWAVRFELNWTELFVHSVRLLAIRNWSSFG